MKSLSEETRATLKITAWIMGIVLGTAIFDVAVHFGKVPLLLAFTCGAIAGYLLRRWNLV